MSSILLHNDVDKDGVRCQKKERERERKEDGPRKCVPVTFAIMMSLLNEGRTSGTLVLSRTCRSEIFHVLVLSFFFFTGHSPYCAVNDKDIHGHLRNEGIKGRLQRDGFNIPLSLTCRDTPVRLHARTHARTWMSWRLINAVISTISVILARTSRARLSSFTT